MKSGSVHGQRPRRVQGQLAVVRWMRLCGESTSAAGQPGALGLVLPPEAPTSSSTRWVLSVASETVSESS